MRPLPCQEGILDPAMKIVTNKLAGIADFNLRLLRVACSAGVPMLLPNMRCDRDLQIAQIGLLMSLRAGVILELNGLGHEFGMA